MENSDKAKFAAWLQSQPHEASTAIGTRDALRVLPFATNVKNVDEDTEQFALLILRCILTAGVATQFRTPEVKKAASLAGSATEAIRSTFYAKYDPKRAAVFAARIAAHDKIDSGAVLAEFAVRMPDSEALDAAFLDMGLEPRNLRDAKVTVPNLLKNAIASRMEDTTDLLVLGGSWDFWRRWYEGAMAGQPLDWELQRRVALIPDEDWKLGPERIAELIAEIEARFALEQRIAELEAHLAEVQQARLGIGGNFPPEGIEEAPVFKRGLEVIWEPLLELKTEVEAKQPDPAKIEHSTSKLEAVLAACVDWIGRKADLAVDTSIKYGIPAAAGYFALNPEKLSAVIEAAQLWLKSRL